MRQGKLDFVGLSAALLGSARSILIKWFPSGVVEGNEFLIGNIHGEPGRSLRINLRTGAWCDFANPDVYRGGDLVSLYAAKENIGQGEAAKALASIIGFQLIPQAVQLPEVIKPPFSAPIPSLIHRIYGKPSMSWTYRDQNDDVLFYIARYDPVGGKKQIVPWTWSAKSSRFTMKAWPSPRPLYGLELLKSRPDAPICLVEGEKACDAARRLAGKAYIVMSWPNGGQSVQNVDYSPIFGRKILLWPDADEAGLKAMAMAASILRDHAPEIKVINPSDKRDGWDAADAINDGWTSKEFFAWAKTKVQTLDVAVAQDVLPKEAAVQLDEDSGPISESTFVLWQKAELVLDKRQMPVINLDNMMRLMNFDPSLKGIVWYDEFHNRFYTRDENNVVRQWDEFDDNQLLIYFQRKLDVRRATKELVKDAAKTYGRQNPKNEAKDWLNSLQWDETPRIERFFVDALGAYETAFSLAASKNFWVSMAARIFAPGCKVDEMIVLEGAQGTYKSTALSVIGGPWYSQASSKPGEKDFYQGLQGKLLIEIAELSSFSKVDINIIKKDLSNACDDIRVAYGEYHKKFPRTCVFAGTTNESTYLNDPTGGRRFWPIRVGKIDIEYIRQNRDLLFAEAVHAFKSGSSWHEMPIAETLKEQDERQITDAWEDQIAHFLATKDWIKIQDVATICLGIEMARFDLTIQKRIARCMRRLGWVNKDKRVYGKVIKAWVPAIEKPNFFENESETPSQDVNF